MFDVALFLSNLKTKNIARNIKYIQSLSSTNTVIYEMLMNNEIDIKDVLIAEQQTDGRGRRGDKWFSSKNKSLTFSFIINSEELSINKLSLLVGISIITGIQKAVNIRFKLKWPNDIFFGSKLNAKTVLVNSGVSNFEDANNADIVIESFSEVVSFIF